MPKLDCGRTTTDRKDVLRGRIRAARAGRSPAARAAAQQAVTAAVTRWCRDALAPAAVVAAFVPLASEALAPDALSALSVAGFDVIVPITLADNDLEWRRWDDERTLGLDAIRDAALVLVPAFAVDPLGRRLGRGAGCYDRALTRTARDAVTAAVVFDDELIDEVPTASWDVPVTAVFTPAGFGARPLRT